MSASDSPYVPADQEPKELTIRVLVVGVILGILMTAANAYLGLYAGITVSASIPAAVMSMIILRSLFKDVSILENNAVQTMASAGESLAAGVIFTVPAMLIIGIWVEIEWFPTLSIALLGGLLGTMFTIALRRLFIVEEALPYPEGVACREVLVAGEEGGSGAMAIVYALGIGALYGLMVKGFKVTQQSAETAFEVLKTRIYGGIDLSVALLSVGFIVGIKIASFIFLGGLIGYGILVPLYGYLNGWPESATMAKGFYGLWVEQIRFVGVGAMVVGGIYTLWSMRKTIINGLKKSFIQSDSENEIQLRTDKDLPLKWVTVACGVLIVLTFFFYWLITGSLILSLAGAMFLALVSFFFAAVAGYIAGVVGSSNSPVSGMTIATLLFTVGLVWIVGSLFLGLEQTELMYATLLIASVVASSAAIAGDVMQDLKTGHMVGATPWRQQVAEIVGVVTGAFVIGPTIALLHNAFQISATACNATNEQNAAANLLGGNEKIYPCEDALLAPQAELIGAIVKGAFVGEMNLPMVFLGAALAVVLIRLSLPVMSVAIGIYLPLKLSVPIMLGGILSSLAIGSAFLRVDGTLDREPSKKAKEAAQDVESRGVLIGAGFIAGESILGVVIAVLIVADMDLSKMLGLNALSQTMSILFFAWFVGVFIWLATRTLPDGGNLAKEIFRTAVHYVKKFIRSLMPQAK